eukprot:SAG11_NODE_274_length_11310_cov_4.717510_10_plen_129_part_00
MSDSVRQFLWEGCSRGLSFLQHMHSNRSGSQTGRSGKAHITKGAGSFFLGASEYATAEAAAQPNVPSSTVITSDVSSDSVYGIRSTYSSVSGSCKNWPMRLSAVPPSIIVCTVGGQCPICVNYCQNGQ